jgi:hypothetical protein
MIACFAGSGSGALTWGRSEGWWGRSTTGRTHRDATTATHPTPTPDQHTYTPRPNGATSVVVVLHQARAGTRTTGETPLAYKESENVTTTISAIPMCSAGSQ